MQKISEILAWSGTISGGILILGGLWTGIFDPLIYNAMGEYRTDGVFSVLSPLLLQLRDPLFQCLVGVPLLFAGFSGLVFLHCRASGRSNLLHARPLTSVALAIVALSHFIVLAISVQFFFVPAGLPIRPMGWAGFIGIVSMVSLLVAAPFSIVATI